MNKVLQRYKKDKKRFKKNIINTIYFPFIYHAYFTQRLHSEVSGREGKL